MKIDLQGADNIRNFMGLMNSRGKTIVSPAIIRSNLLNSITEEDIRILREQYKLKKIIDLRTETEIREKPDIRIPGVEYINIPLFLESAIGLTHEENSDKCIITDGDKLDMKKLYVRLVSDEYSVSQLSKVMRHIADCIKEASGAVLWHCTEGKDRCGIVSAMVLAMLEVDREVILQDYLETNRAAVKRAEQFYEEILAVTGDRERAQKAEKAFLANEDYLNAALSDISRSCSSIQEFLICRLDISEEEMKQIRKICLN
ncbi:MAG: tyrosine-protein phosphatase [Lachnospiraceae bacterium]|nr:tyrosine-protein phosphatase [Lachnospiraceae bacterium]